MDLKGIYCERELAMNVPDRWATYVMASGSDLQSLMKSHFGARKRNVCFIMGRGFDPRMNLGLRTLLTECPGHSYRVLVLEFSEGQTSPSNRYASMVDSNSKDLQEITKTLGKVESREIVIWSTDGRRIGSRSAANLFSEPADIDKYTDIFVDVSSLPRSIFFPLLAKLLHIIEKKKGGEPTNLFTLVAENSDIDTRIVDEGIDEEADFVDLFRSGADRMSSSKHPKVWFPILGESQGIQLRRIHDLVGPDEICPVLPSPSMLPRRSDSLVGEYHGLLFDQMRVEPKNFIFASERNPFEAYRQISRAIRYYNEVLKPLGGCRSIISSVSSKLLSLGGLLAAYELKRMKYDIAIAHVEAQGYSIVDQESIDGLLGQSSLFALWLAGECYE
jgi:hypothetical protein